MTMSVDFETRSPVDLPKAGVYAYSEDPDTDILCMSYAFGDEEPETWRPGEPMPARVREHVESGGEIRAWNATFERVLWWVVLTPRYGFPRPRAEQFVCTAAEARAMNLPGSLAWAAEVTGVSHRKDTEGHRLMLKLSSPVGKNPKPPYEWHEDPADLRRLVEYCEQDVRTERAIARVLVRLSPVERAIYLLDQRINDRGVRADLPLVDAMSAVVEDAMTEAGVRLDQLTDGVVTAVTQTARIKEWCNRRFVEEEITEQRTGTVLIQGEEVETTERVPFRIPGVAKNVLRETLLLDVLPEDVREVLEIRQECGKTSPGKLKAIKRGIGRRDDRLRGLLLYHGAGTGRWSGRRVQPQNFPRPDVEDVEQYIPAVMRGDRIVGPSPMSVVTSMLRSCLIASEGHHLMAADYGQIEARVTHWFAGEPWEDNPYERMAGFIYGRPWQEIEEDSVERQIGKNTVLGAGFGMGAEKFQEYTYIATGIRIPLEEAERAINGYRMRKSGIRDLWYELEQAAEGAVLRPGEITSAGTGAEVQYVASGQWLMCRLPSGRAIFYCRPKVEWVEVPWSDTDKRRAVTFEGVNTYTRKWTRGSMYGGLQTENVVQATARDIMAAAMARVEDAGYPVVLTVHDEIIADVPNDHGSLEDFERLMSRVPKWASGVPIDVKGWEGQRWRK